MNTEKTFDTTYFTWELENGKPTGKLNEKKCSYLENIGEVYIVPFQENDTMNTSNCPVFAVRTNESKNKVYLSYFFKAPNKYIKSAYTTVLDETEPIFHRTLEFNIPAGISKLQEPEDIYPIVENFELIPDQVLKLCHEEVLRLKGTKDIFPLTLKKKLDLLLL